MSEVMNTPELVNYYAEYFGITKKQAKAELYRFAELGQHLILDEEVGFRVGDFGRFVIVKRKGREYKIPDGSGKRKIVPDHKALQFLPNYHIKDILKERIVERDE